MRLHEKGAGVPYGIALAAAALMIYPQTGWMSHLAGSRRVAMCAAASGGPAT